MVVKHSRRENVSFGICANMRAALLKNFAKEVREEKNRERMMKLFLNVFLNGCYVYATLGVEKQMVMKYIL